MIVSMIVAVVEVDMEDATTVEVVIMMTEIEDTEEVVIDTTMAHVLTATVMTDMSDVEEEATLLTAMSVAAIVAGIVVEIVTEVAPAMPHQQPNMVIQLLVQKLENPMVAATPMRELMLVENFEC